jgi:hypothetical protein
MSGTSYGGMFQSKDDLRRRMKNVIIYLPGLNSHVSFFFPHGGFLHIFLEKRTKEK